MYVCTAVLYRHSACSILRLIPLGSTRLAEKNFIIPVPPSRLLGTLLKTKCSSSCRPEKKNLSLQIIPQMAVYAAVAAQERHFTRGVSSSPDVAPYGLSGNIQHCLILLSYRVLPWKEEYQIGS